MKELILKILFILSFVPLIFIVYWIMNCWLNGINSHTLGEYYGFEALEFGIKLFLGMEAGGQISVPVLLVCLIYQIIYLFRKK